MRHVKVLGLALVVALTAIAIGSSSSASATVFCGSNEGKCSSENDVGVPTTLESELNGGSATFEGTFKAECSKSEITGQLTETTGAEKPLLGQVTAARFEGCSTCKKVEALNLPWSAEISSTGGGNGTLTVKKPELLMEDCTVLKITCTISAESIALDITGGSPATVKAVSESLKGGSCSENWTATHKLAAPGGSDWVSEATSSTTMCAAEPEKNEAGEFVCPKGKGFSGKIEGELEKEAEATLTSSEGTISCDELSLEGSISENGTMSITSMLYGSKGGPCTSTLPNKPKVEVEAGNLPYNRTSIAYQQQPPAPQGTIIVGGDPGRPIKIIRIGTTKCVYGFVERKERYVAGPPPGMQSEVTWARTAEIPVNTPAVCPTPITEEWFTPIVPAGGGAGPQPSR